MSRTAEILDQMTAVLNELKVVMDNEQQQLCMGHINGSLLQRITEEKARFLQRSIILNSKDVESS